MTGLSIYSCGSNSNFIKYKQINFLSDKVGAFNFYKFFDFNPHPISSFDFITIHVKIESNVALMYEFFGTVGSAASIGMQLTPKGISFATLVLTIFFWYNL